MIDITNDCKKNIILSANSPIMTFKTRDEQNKLMKLMEENWIKQVNFHGGHSYNELRIDETCKVPIDLHEIYEKDKLKYNIFKAFVEKSISSGIALPSGQHSPIPALQKILINFMLNCEDFEKINICPDIVKDSMSNHDVCEIFLQKYKNLNEMYEQFENIVEKPCSNFNKLNNYNFNGISNIWMMPIVMYIVENIGHNKFLEDEKSKNLIKKIISVDTDMIFRELYTDKYGYYSWDGKKSLRINIPEKVSRCKTREAKTSKHLISEKIITKSNIDENINIIEENSLSLDDCSQDGSSLDENNKKSTTLEKITSYNKIYESNGKDLDVAAKIAGVSKSTLKQYITMNSLPPDILKLLDETGNNRLSIRLASELVKLPICVDKMDILNIISSNSSDAKIKLIRNFIEKGYIFSCQMDDVKCKFDVNANNIKLTDPHPPYVIYKNDRVKIPIHLYDKIYNLIVKNVQNPEILR